MSKSRALKDVEGIKSKSGMGLAGAGSVLAKQKDSDNRDTKPLAISGKNPYKKKRG